MNIEIAKKAKKFIESRKIVDKQKIKEGIEGLLKMPAEGDIDTMKGQKKNKKVFRLRVGSFRIVYEYIGNDVLYIKEVDNRGDIY